MPDPASRFQPAECVERLRSFPDVLAAIVADVAESEWRWKPAPEHWAVAEILGHLAREEREDFRPRLESTLRDPAEPWPAIDPEGDVKRFNDLAGDPQVFRDEFRRLRRENLASVSYTH